MPLLFLDDSFGLCRPCALVVFEESPLTEEEEEEEEEMVVVELERSLVVDWWCIEGRVLD